MKHWLILVFFFFPAAVAQYAQSPGNTSEYDTILAEKRKENIILRNKIAENDRVIDSLLFKLKEIRSDVLVKSKKVNKKKHKKQEVALVYEKGVDVAHPKPEMKKVDTPSVVIVPHKVKEKTWAGKMINKIFENKKKKPSNEKRQQ